MPTSLILDTNVLVAGLRSSRGASHELLSRAGTGLFNHGLTAALVLEYESVLKRPGLVPLSDKGIEALLDYLCESGTCCAVRFGLRPTASDPGDDLVIEAAVAAGCEWIVTHNPTDMLDAVLHGIELVSPGDALRRLGVNR